MFITNTLNQAKNYLWDRKTIIVNVGINKKVTDDDYNFTNIQSFLVEYDEINSLWNIKHLKEIAAERERYYDGSNVLGIIEKQLFFNSDISLCHRQVLMMKVLIFMIIHSSA